MHQLLGVILLQLSLLTSDTALTNGLMSLEVRNMHSGKTISAYRAKEAATPASITKLLSTGAALEILGPDFQFETALAYTGEVKDSTLWGDLIIIGDVDPTLGNLKNGEPFLQTWIDHLHDCGIYYIQGQIVADMSKLSDEGYNPHWLAEDVGNYFAPGIWGINYLSNTLKIYLHSGEIGTQAEVMFTEPKVEGLIVTSKVRGTRVKRDYAYVSGKPLVWERKLRGEIPANRDSFCVKGDLPNPGLQLANDLQEAFEASGGKVSGGTYYVLKGTAPESSRTLLCIHLSPLLKDIIRDTNFESNNMYAEAITRYLGAREHKHSTCRQAANYLFHYWQKQGMPMKCCKLYDGCGLAPDNKLTAHMILQLLDAMYKSEYRDDWYASLPVSGQSGTLTHFLEGTRLSGKVHAKSGTLTGAKCYAGYIERPNGQLWSFAIMISDTKTSSQNIQRAIEKYLLSICS